MSSKPNYIFCAHYNRHQCTRILCQAKNFFKKFKENVITVILCGYCYKPTSRRLANFKVKDDFECYSESYIKCFWGLCDHQRNETGFITKQSEKVITKQPKRQLPY